MTRAPRIAQRAEQLLGIAVVATADVAGGDTCHATKLRLSDGTTALAKTAPHVPDGFFESEAAALRQRLPDALAVEMEGAALAQVCHDLGVPFAVVRTISDRADDSAHGDFSRFVESISSRYSVGVVRGFLRGGGARAP